MANNLIWDELSLLNVEDQTFTFHPAHNGFHVASVEARK